MTERKKVFHLEPDLVVNHGLNWLTTQKAWIKWLINIISVYLFFKSNSPSEVFPFLYLGAQDDLSESKIKKSKITHVLNATKDLEKPNIIEKENFLRIPVLDSQCETILNFLEEPFSS